MEQVQDLTEKLGKVEIKITERKNGTVRIQQDFSNCPSLTDQSQAHQTNLNYLIERFKPDELAAYMAARTAYRQEVLGHDFSEEPNLQEAKNKVYVAKKAFDELPEDIRTQFPNVVEFLKYIDNPANAELLIKLGALKPKQVEDLQSTEVIQTKEVTPTKNEEKG